MCGGHGPRSSCGGKAAGERGIGTAPSAARIFVVPANEEACVARAAWAEASHGVDTSGAGAFGGAGIIQDAAAGDRPNGVGG